MHIKDCLPLLGTTNFATLNFNFEIISRINNNKLCKILFIYFTGYSIYKLTTVTDDGVMMRWNKVNEEKKKKRSSVKAPAKAHQSLMWCVGLNMIRVVYYRAQ